MHHSTLPASRPGARRGRLAALLALWLAAACGEAPAPRPDVAAAVGLYRVGAIHDPARPTYHDFGEVAPGATLEHTFEFRNGSRRPISILRMASSCSCTIPGLEAVLPDGTRIDGDPFDPNVLLEVPPEAVARITLRVDPDAVQDANRDKLVTVRITTDSPATPYLALEAHLVVREQFQIAPEELDFGQVATSLGADQDVTLLRISDEAYTVGALRQVPAGFVAQVVPHTAGPAGTWLVHVDVEPGLEPGAYAGTIQVELLAPDGEPARLMSIPVRAQVVENIGLSPRFFSLRPVQGRLVHEIELSSRIPGRVLALEAAQVLGPLAEELELTWRPDRPDPLGRAARWTLRLEAALTIDLDRLSESRVEVLLDDERTPRIEIPIKPALGR